MAGTPISKLPGIVNPILTDLIPLVQGGITDKGTLDQILSLFLNSLKAGSGLLDGELLIGSTGNTPIGSPLTAGRNIAIVNGAGTVTINATGAASFEWLSATSTSQALVVNTGYVANNASLVTFTLPTTASLGDRISIIGSGVGGWKIAQNSMQNIQVGVNSSTVGVAGFIASTNRYDSINLVCIEPNLVWSTLGAPQGTITTS